MLPTAPRVDADVPRMTPRDAASEVALPDVPGCTGSKTTAGVLARYRRPRWTSTWWEGRGQEGTNRSQSQLEKECVVPAPQGR